MVVVVVGFCVWIVYLMLVWFYGEVVVMFFV